MALYCADLFVDYFYSHDSVDGSSWDGPYVVWVPLVVATYENWRAYYDDDDGDDDGDMVAIPEIVSPKNKKQIK